MSITVLMIALIPRADADRVCYTKKMAASTTTTTTTACDTITTETVCAGPGCLWNSTLSTCSEVPFADRYTAQYDVRCGLGGDCPSDNVLGSVVLGSVTLGMSCTIITAQGERWRAE